MVSSNNKITTDMRSGLRFSMNNGEIRDIKAANAQVHTNATGHCVFLHSNNFHSDVLYAKP